jgi:DNA-directed RNA polymerase specialized sigma24 family protein
MAKSNRSTFARIRPHHHFAYDEDFGIPIAIDPQPAAERSEPLSPTALGALVRIHRTQLLRTARAKLGLRREDAEDLVQQVCLDALEGRLALSAAGSEVAEELREEVLSRCKSWRRS